MIRMLVSTLIYILANALGLFVATLLLPGFNISPMAFVWATLLFTAIEVVAGPLFLKMSIKNIPAMQGGVALITTFLGLYVTAYFVDGMEIGGLANWLAATLLVWLGTLLAAMILPAIMFKSVLQNRK